MKVEEQLSEGEMQVDKADGSTYGEQGVSSDTGYFININDKTFDSLQGSLDRQYSGTSGIDVGAYIDTRKAFTVAHETEHAYQRYFDPLSLDSYKMDDGMYNTDLKYSTTWAEDAANLAGMHELGITPDIDGQYTITAGGLQTTKNLLNPEMVKPEDLGSVETSAVRPLYDTNDISGILQSTQEATGRDFMSALAMRKLWKRRKARQLRRGE